MSFLEDPTTEEQIETLTEAIRVMEHDCIHGPYRDYHEAKLADLTGEWGQPMVDDEIKETIESLQRKGANITKSIKYLKKKLITKK